LKDIDLTICENEFVTLVGASGCGKSTLLRIIGGLDYNTSGEISVTAGRCRAGPRTARWCFPALQPVPMADRDGEHQVRRRLKADRSDLTSPTSKAHPGAPTRLLNLMGMPEASHRPGRTSFRAANAATYRIACALMPRPGSAADGRTVRCTGCADARGHGMTLILHVFKLERATIVFVTHDVEEAIYLGQRVVVMAPRPGRIDSVYDVPLPAKRHQDMKHTPEFLALKRAIVSRIRETSGMKTEYRAAREARELSREG